MLVIFALIGNGYAKSFAVTSGAVPLVTAMVCFTAGNIAWLDCPRAGSELSQGSILFSKLVNGGAVLIGLV